MAEAFLSLGDRERKEVLETAAIELRRPESILEKDIWICWLLQSLFSIPDRLPMAFKGGTSLSKVYRIIDRFSEDVDITLDYRSLDSSFDAFDPGATRADVRRFICKLKSSVGSYLREVVEPVLQAAVGSLTTPRHHDITIDIDGECIWFAYRSAVEYPTDYMQSRVLLEFGGQNVVIPNELHKICPYIADVTEGLEYPAATVAVLSAARTFWEKATLVHAECHRRRLTDGPERLSRHWFDLSCLAQHHSGLAALSDRALLQDVVRHKKVFFYSTKANYDHCLNGRFRLVPDVDQLASLKSDYDDMRTSRILSTDAPQFDALIEQIRILETNINS